MNEKDEKYQFIIDRLNEHYEELVNRGYTVFLLALQGSQNYGLDIYNDEYKSDIDSKAIVLPPINSVYLGKKPVSTTIVLDNNEHIDVKDIREMFSCFKKQNINFLEILYTDYMIMNTKYLPEIDFLLKYRDSISSYSWNKVLSCSLGMCFKKRVDMTHEFPNAKDKLDKFGYDPKQLHHILRMYDFMQKFIEGKPYIECLKPDNIDYLKRVKEGIEYTKEEALEVADKTIELIKELKDANVKDEKPNKMVDDLLDTIVIDTFKKRAKENS